MLDKGQDLPLGDDGVSHEVWAAHSAQQFPPERKKGDEMSMSSVVFPILSDREMSVLTYLIKLS